MVPYLLGEIGAQRDYVYAEEFRLNYIPNEQGRPPPGYAPKNHDQTIRDAAGHKLIRYVSGTGLVMEEEFYYLPNDPLELENLIELVGAPPYDGPYQALAHELESNYPNLLLINDNNDVPVSIKGKPAYQPGAEEGLYLWRESFDGPYHMEISGSGPLSQFSFELIADQPIDSVIPRQLEANDTLAWSGHHLAFTGWVSNWIDGLDFQLPPGTRAMIAVEQDGTPSPSQLHVGASGLPLSTSGWIVAADSLPAPPPFLGGQDLGLFIGRDAASGEVHARWNGDGQNHRAGIELLFSQSPGAITPVGLEMNDVLVAAANSVSIDSYVGTWWDGVNIDVPPATRMGLMYTQDGLVQTDWVNPQTHDLGMPNTYLLPKAEPYGKPVYDPGTEAGLYLWQDKTTGAWHLRGAAGGGGGRYAGELVSDQPFITVSAVSIETNDVLDTTDPLRIVFDLGMGNQWEDGIDFQAAPGTQLTLNLTTGHPFAIPGKAVRIGESKWPVDNLPLNLGGW